MEIKEELGKREGGEARDGEEKVRKRKREELEEERWL